ncbi:MAG: hypothetical protein H7A25_09445 [Leptospiraceae bacterium]|nr:hypothetical protein [Leptospiraceae bacterium]MCP5500114.1 hypothetical protein [Leptospiraceae bacterium]
MEIIRKNLLRYIFAELRKLIQSDETFFRAVSYDSFLEIRNELLELKNREIAIPQVNVDVIIKALDEKLEHLQKPESLKEERIKLEHILEEKVMLLCSLSREGLKKLELQLEENREFFAEHLSRESENIQEKIEKEGDKNTKQVMGKLEDIDKKLEQKGEKVDGVTLNAIGKNSKAIYIKKNKGLTIE